MPQQKRDLIVGQSEDLLRQTLLVGALAVDSEILQPLPDSSGVPTVAIAADEKLVPLTSCCITLDGRTELLGRGAHRFAVLLGSGRVPEGLMGQITAIANQMPQQDQPMVRPPIR